MKVHDPYQAVHILLKVARMTTEQSLNIERLSITDQEMDYTDQDFQDDARLLCSTFRGMLS